jgi:hypothetical protein
MVGTAKAMERVVRFYRIVDKEQLPFPGNFPFEDLQDAIDALDDSQAYVMLNRMELLGSSWDSGPGAGAKRQVSLIALDRITRNPQLRVERRRKYRPLVLGDNENLADPAFFSVFDDGVIGILRVSELSPGAASIRDYINHLEILKPAIAIVPLVDGNSARALGDIGTLTKLTVRVLPDASEDIFGRAPLFYDTIRSTRRNMGAVGVEMTVKIRPKGQDEAAEEAHREISNIVTTEAIGYTDKAFINYRRIEDGKAATHDFLQEAITKTVVVETDTETGQPAESSVSEALAVAYDTLYDEIRSAIHPRE